METLIVGIIAGFLIGVPAGMAFEDAFDLVKFRDKIRKKP